MGVVFEDGDFYWSEAGYRVFTEQYLRKRGYCCLNNCKHCPYGYDANINTTQQTKSPK